LFPLYYQLSEQLKRLMKYEEIERIKNSFVSFENSQVVPSRGTNNDLTQPLLRNTQVRQIEMRGGFCYNMRLVWRY
jgi:hypothetical protein